MYKLVQPAKKGAYLWLDSKTNQPTKSITKWVCADTGTLLMDSQIKYAYTYGGEKIIFDKEEVNAIKNFDMQGLRLMGFKPMDSLKSYNIRTADFIYPDEFSIKGSTSAFAALLDRMLALKKIAICKITPRSEASPRFVALTPQAETFDADGTQNTPPGFHVVYLPYADDIRNLKLEATPKATTDQIDKAKKLVKTLRIKFDSRNFENPSLQKHYANLQAIALEREAVEEVPDYVIPDEAGMEKFADIIDAYREAVFPPDYEPITSKTKKRKPEDGENPKKEKATPTNDEISSAARNDGLKKFTVPQLKAWLSSQGVKVPSKWKKDELLQKVKEMAGTGSATTSQASAPRPAPQQAQHHSDEDEESEEPLQQPQKKQKTRVVDEEEEEEEEHVHQPPPKPAPKPTSKPVSKPSPKPASKPVEKMDVDEDEEEEEEKPKPSPVFSQSQSKPQQKPSSSLYSQPSMSKAPSQSQMDSQKPSPKNQSQMSSQDSTTSSKPGKPVCQFGPKCYRRNPQHFQEFAHPWKDNADWITSSQSQSESQTL